MLTHVDPKDLGASPGEFEGVEACVAADVQHPPATEVCRDVTLDHRPFVGRKISPDQRMTGSSLDSTRQVKVVEPWTEPLYLSLERVLRRGGGTLVTHLRSHLG